jgi:hypothetical protein
MFYTLTTSERYFATINERGIATAAPIHMSSHPIRQNITKQKTAIIKDTIEPLPLETMNVAKTILAVKNMLKNAPAIVRVTPINAAIETINVSQNILLPP